MPASSKKALVGALAANLAIAATKFVVGAITHTTVITVEGIHSLVDTGNSGLMLFGRWRSRRPADEDHPFGYGMELYFWSFVVAMVVFGGGGAVSLYEGVRALAAPHRISTVWPNYAVLAAAALFEGASLWIGLREFGRYRREKRFAGSMIAVIHASKNPAIFVTVLEDGAALIGLAIAAAGVAASQLLANPIFDGVASILIGGVLMVEAGLLGYECRGLIIGESARPQIITAIRSVATRYPQMGPVESMRTLQLGPESVLLLLRMRFVATLSIGELGRLGGELESELRRSNPIIQHIAFDLTPRTR
jgi:cation diffusion facilitator family transporter